MSSTGLTWCFEVLSALDPWSEDTISRPAVMLVGVRAQRQQKDGDEIVAHESAPLRAPRIWRSQQLALRRHHPKQVNLPG